MKAFRFLSFRRRNKTEVDDGSSDAVTSSTSGDQAEPNDSRQAQSEAAEPTAPSTGSPATDAGQPLFSTIPASQLGAVKHFIDQLKRGATTQEWVVVCRPVLSQMLEVAEAAGLSEIAARTRDLRAAVSMARSEDSQLIDSFARGLILSCWDELAAEMPQSFEINDEDRRRERIIVEALLRQLPEVGHATLEKLDGAGFTSVAVLRHTSVADLSSTTGIPAELCEQIHAKVSQHQEVLQALGGEEASSTPHDWLTTSVSELGRAHEAFERASEADQTDEKRESRRRRNTCALQVEVVLAEMQQLEMLEELQKLGVGPRIEILETYLKESVGPEDAPASSVTSDDHEVSDNG